MMSRTGLSKCIVIQGYLRELIGNGHSSVDIPLSEGPVNLNWGPIMKTINEDPYDFFQGGGWTFLGGSAGGDEVSDT